MQTKLIEFFTTQQRQCTFALKFANYFGINYICISSYQVSTPFLEI